MGYSPRGCKESDTTEPVCVCARARAHTHTLGFSGGSVVKNLPAIQEMRVQSPGQEDPLEKEMETHSSIPVWEIPWTEEPGGLQSVGSQESDTT